jgi:hypothetical protein
MPNAMFGLDEGASRTGHHPTGIGVKPSQSESNRSWVARPPFAWFQASIELAGEPPALRKTGLARVDL